KIDKERFIGLALGVVHDLDRDSRAGLARLDATAEPALLGVQGMIVVVGQRGGSVPRDVVEVHRYNAGRRQADREGEQRDARVSFVLRDIVDRQQRGRVVVQDGGRA